MALTQRSRTFLYQRLTDTLEDEVAVGELLSYFPARDVEEPASTEFVAAQIAAYRAEGKAAASESLAWADFCQVLFGLNEFVYVE